MSGRRRVMLGVSALAALGVLSGLFLLRTPSTSGEKAEAPAAPPKPTAVDTPSPASPGAPARTASPMAPAEPVRQLPRVVVERGGPAPAGAFSGRVVSAATGEGVAGAEVTLAAPGGAASRVTDSQGRFEFQPEAPGVYQVAAIRAEGFLPFGPEWGRSPISLSAMPGVRVSEIVIALMPAPELVGQVLSASGEPVAGAAARVFTGRVGESVLFPVPDRFVSDARGEFRFTAPEGASVEARHPAHGAARVQVSAEALRSRRLEVRLPGAASGPRSEGLVSGRVLAPDGSGASGALVSVRSAVSAYPRVFGPPDGTQAMVEVDGSFAIEGLEPGLYDISALADGFAPARAFDVRIPASGLTLRLSEGGALVGRVLEESGAPVPSFLVNLLTRRGPLERLPFAEARFIDAEGRYGFRGLTPGQYVLQVAAAGFPLTEHTFEVKEGTREVRMDVVLARGARLEGRVLSAATRAPIAGARIIVETGLVTSALSPLFDAVSGPDGAFTLEGLPPTPVALNVSAPGHATRLVQDVRPGAPLVAELTPLEPDAGPRIELVGIGAVLRARGDALVIGDVLPGAGAQEAGLVPGDEIIHIDGKPVVDLGFAGSIPLIRGPEGSQVLLGVRKAGQTQVVDITVTRKKTGG